MSSVPNKLGKTRTGETYKHSGKVPAKGMLLVAFALIPFAIVMGVLYSFGIVYLPFMKIRVVVTLFFGGALGGLSAIVCHKAKFRSRLAVFLVILLVSATSYYASWAVHHTAFGLRKGALNVPNAAVDALEGFAPKNIYRWAKIIHDNGIWSVGKGKKLKGIGVCILWALEALIIFGTAISSRGKFGSAPFCEDCDEWTNETVDLANLPVAPDDPAWDKFSTGDLDAVKKLQLVVDSMQYVELQVATCPTCENSDFVSAVGVVLKHGKDGEFDKKTKPIVRHLRISRTQHDEIQAFASAMAEAVATMDEEMDIDDLDDISPIAESTPEEPI